MTLASCIIAEYSAEKSYAMVRVQQEFYMEGSRPAAFVRKGFHAVGWLFLLWDDIVNKNEQRRGFAMCLLGGEW